MNSISYDLSFDSIILDAFIRSFFLTAPVPSDRLAPMNTIVTLGEIMLRLKSPSYERLFQSPLLEATFGGGEANVAVSLACLGLRSSYVTALPEGPIGDAALQQLSRYGVDTSRVIRASGRMGVYFLEAGSCQRPSSVIYDREGSAISLISSQAFDWTRVFSDARWFHCTGITPAISAEAALLSHTAIVAAKKAGCTVSLDLNYRKKLWGYGKTAPSVMGPLVSLCDVLIANEEDIQKSLGIKEPVPASMDDLDGYRALMETVQNHYPNLSYIAITLRQSVSADVNGWMALLRSPQGVYQSRRYDITDIVDRVGAGDAFSAGLIASLAEKPVDAPYALEFATAASCLKHTISGDFNLSTRKEIEALLAGDSSGRVQR